MEGGGGRGFVSALIDRVWREKRDNKTAGDSSSIGCSPVRDADKLLSMEAEFAREVQRMVAEGWVHVEPTSPNGPLLIPTSSLAVRRSTQPLPQDMARDIEVACRGGGGGTRTRLSAVCEHTVVARDEDVPFVRAEFGRRIKTSENSDPCSEMRKACNAVMRERGHAPAEICACFRVPLAKCEGGSGRAAAVVQHEGLGPVRCCNIFPVLCVPAYADRPAGPRVCVFWCPEFGAHVRLLAS